MSSTVVCQICNRPVTLESARINEHGKAVHEECYLNSIKSSRKESFDEPKDGDSDG